MKATFNHRSLRIPAAAPASHAGKLVSLENRLPCCMGLVAGALYVDLDLNTVGEAVHHVHELVDGEAVELHVANTL